MGGEWEGRQTREIFPWKPEKKETFGRRSPRRYANIRCDHKQVISEGMKLTHVPQDRDNRKL